MAGMTVGRDLTDGRVRVDRLHHPNGELSLIISLDRASVPAERTLNSSPTALPDSSPLPPLRHGCRAAVCALSAALGANVIDVLCLASPFGALPRFRAAPSARPLSPPPPLAR